MNTPSLVVVGVDADGAEVARLVLGHGDDPSRLLTSSGWKVCCVRDIVRHPARRHVLTMTFVVVRSREVVSPSEVATSVGSVMVAGEVALRHQRVAAYAVVTSARGFLMTQFSDRTSAPGQWGLPGGGLEPGESPKVALVREVWEESGQVIEVSDLASITTRHWVGHAPTGRLEDFHAVRVTYRAVCRVPTEPVVHDVGGTTAAAAWWPAAELDLLDLTAGWRSVLSDVVMAPGKTDGPDHHHHDTDTDDRSGRQS